MSRYVDPADASKQYKDPTPLPADIPKVKELGVTSAPLKSAAFFLGAYCKDYNGVCLLSLCKLQMFLFYGMWVVKLYPKGLLGVLGMGHERNS